MLSHTRLYRAFAWKKALSVPGLEAVVRRKRRIDLAKILVSGLTSGLLFASEWYTLSTFAAMAVGALFVKRLTDPVYPSLVLQLETDEENRSAARIKTPQGYYRLNIDTITPLTDVYPAYRALENAQELIKNSDDQLADFDDGSKSSLAWSKKALQDITDDTIGHFVSVKKGKVIQYHEFPDRFHFFFKQDDTIFVVGFPFTPDISFESRELMRVLAGNKELKPRRSVMLTQEDEKKALEEQDKLRARLKGDQPKEIEPQKKGELPESL